MIRAARVTGQRQCVGPEARSPAERPREDQPTSVGLVTRTRRWLGRRLRPGGDPAMTTYLVDCETCLHRGTYPTHEAAIAEAEAHAKAHPDHTVNVTEEQDDEGVRA
jgi:hypothetical protein